MQKINEPPSSSVSLLDEATAARRQQAPHEAERAVLVVDEQGQRGHQLAVLLADWKLKPVVVDSAQAALLALQQAQAEGQPFTLLLLTMQQPGDWVLAERIRRVPGFAELIIIVLTNGQLLGTALRCQELGIAACLPLPVELAALWQTLVACVPAPSAQGGAAPTHVNLYQPPTTMAQTAVLAQTETDPQMWETFAEVFCESYPQQLAELRHALAVADQQAVEMIAHRLKGSLSGYAAAETLASVRYLEQASRAGSWCEVQQAGVQLEKEIVRFTTALRARVKQTPAS